MVDNGIYKDDGLFQSVFVSELYVGSKSPYKFPTEEGPAGQALVSDGSGKLSFAPVGDVLGPPSSSISAVPVFADASGKKLMGSSVMIDPSGVLYTSGLHSGPLTFPSSDGSSGQYLMTDGAGNLSFSSPAGSGDVLGPASSLPDSLALFDGATGKLLKGCPVTVDPLGMMFAKGLNGLSYPLMDGQYSDSLCSDGLGVLSLKSLVSGKLEALMNKQELVHIALGDHIKFDSVNFQSSLFVNLDKSSPYSSAPGAPSVGRIFLKANKNYLLDCFVSSLAFSTPVGYITLEWFNSDSNLSINTQNVPEIPGTKGIVYGCSCYYTPAVDCMVEVRLVAALDLSSFSRASVKVIQS